MLQSTLRFFLPLTCLFLSFCTRAQVGQTAKLPSGFKFYTLTDSSAFTSADIGKEKKSVIIFFDATCEHCQHEVAGIGERAKDFEKVNLYLISMDVKPEVEKFMSRYGKELKNKKFVTVLLDPDKNFLPNFMPERFPAIYVYSEKQELIWHKDGQREVQELVEAIN
jgi:hypothetical protein